MLEKLVTWFVFSVVLALVPLAATFLFQASRPAANVDLAKLLAEGELLLIAASLCAAATADLFTSSGSRWRIGKVLAGGATVVILLFSAIYYASVDTSRADHVALEALIVYRTSLVLFGSAVLASGACAFLSKA